MVEMPPTESNYRCGARSRYISQLAEDMAARTDNSCRFRPSLANFPSPQRLIALRALVVVGNSYLLPSHPAIAGIVPSAHPDQVLASVQIIASASGSEQDGE
jgi:hypothetical protein